MYTGGAICLEAPNVNPYAAPEALQFPAWKVSHIGRTEKAGDLFALFFSAYEKSYYPPACGNQSNLRTRQGWALSEVETESEGRNKAILRMGYFMLRRIAVVRIFEPNFGPEFSKWKMTELSRIISESSAELQVHP